MKQLMCDFDYDKIHKKKKKKKIKVTKTKWNYPRESASFTIQGGKKVQHFKILSNFTTNLPVQQKIK